MIDRFVLMPILALGVSLSACQHEQIEISLARQGVSELAFAKATLNNLQGLSFAKNREFCGYFVRTPEGSLAATQAKQGRISSCLPFTPPDELLIIASYHTHGAFEYDTPAEFPSVGDVEADESEGVDGYVSTPGGRLWYVDSTELTVNQICGVGCMDQDPNFEAGLDGVIEQSYTLDELRALELE